MFREVDTKDGDVVPGTGEGAVIRAAAVSAGRGSISRASDADGAARRASASLPRHPPSRPELRSRLFSLAGKAQHRSFEGRNVSRGSDRRLTYRAVRRNE